MLLCCTFFPILYYTLKRICMSMPKNNDFVAIRVKKEQPQRCDCPFVLRLNFYGYGFKREFALERSMFFLPKNLIFKINSTTIIIKVNRILNYAIAKFSRRFYTRPISINNNFRINNVVYCILLYFYRFYK